MKKHTLSMLISTGLVGVSLIGTQLALESTAAAQSSTTGAVRGVIRDKGDNNALIAGAPVAATSPSLQGSQVVITDDTGAFFIDSLPPGMYTLTVYWNNAEFTRGNVLIQVGKQAVINVPIDTGTGAPAGEIITIEGSAPIVDQGSTKTGVTITSDYTTYVPVARTFGGVLGKAAGSQGDFYGTSFAGSTSVENTYIVEGINTTDTAFGEQSSNLPTEFVTETEVITGGYNAEYGRSTGGVINVVTKSGSNELHGSVFGYYTPGPLVADAEKIGRQGSAISSVTNLTYQADVGAEIGGPIIKDKLWFHVGYNPSLGGSRRTRTIGTFADDNNDGLADTNEAGFAETTAISDSSWREFNRTHFFTSKLSGQINENNSFQVSVFGNPSTNRATARSNAAPSAQRYNVNDGAYDVSGKFSSKKAWKNGDQTQFDAVVGYHVGYKEEQPLNAAQDVAGIRYERARSLTQFADLEGASNLIGCAPVDKIVDGETVTFYPCPVIGYQEQGLGFIEDRINDRKSLVLSVQHRMNSPIGYHTFKVGFDSDVSGYETTRRYPGNAFFQNYARTLTGGGPIAIESSLLEVVTDGDPANLRPGEQVCGGRVCKSAENGITSSTSNRNLGAYLQDSWQIRPNLTLNAGLRYEQQVAYVADSLKGTRDANGELVPDEGFTLNGMFAPRLGIIFDPTQEGKSKIFAHWGRFYENVPMDLNIRSFGGEVTNQDLLFCAAEHGEPGGSTEDKLRNCTGADRSAYQQLGTSISFVSPGIKGQYMQELVLGTELELFADFKAGVTYVHRSLPRVIEDVSTDAGNHYAITNPGENFDSQADTLSAQSDDFYEQAAEATDMDEQARLEKLGDSYAANAELLYGVKNIDKPSRTYDGVVITATQRPTKASLLVASYTYSRSKGNFPGLFSTETNQLDPNINSIYDLPDLMANRYGALGLDRPHLLKVDGFYQFDLKKAGSVVLGGSFRAESGIPHNTLAGHPVYGLDESYVLGRGTAGRSPTTMQVDVKASYGRKLTKTTTIEGFVDVFNLFNQQAEVDVDDRFSVDSVQPIVGGDAEDLKHAKIVDDSGYTTNATPELYKNFGNTVSRQAPLSMRFGVRLTF